MYLLLVADDILLPFESLSADVTGEVSLVAVDVLFVDLQVAVVGEGLRAGLTAVDDSRLHSMVRTDMLQEAFLIVEGPLAFSTLLSLIHI